MDVATPWTGLAKLPVSVGNAASAHRPATVVHAATGCVRAWSCCCSPHTLYRHHLFALPTPPQERDVVIQYLQELADQGFKQLNVLLLGET